MRRDLPVSADRGHHLCVGRERPGCLLGITQPAINGNLKHAATAPLQCYGGSLLCCKDQIPRRTGAWLVPSHAAIFDFDDHFPYSSIMPPPYAGA